MNTWDRLCYSLVWMLIVTLVRVASVGGLVVFGFTFVFTYNEYWLIWAGLGVLMYVLSTCVFVACANRAVLIERKRMP